VRHREFVLLFCYILLAILGAFVIGLRIVL
jgi:hypothetical protein